MTEYRIGQVAARVGVTTRTIRYYEELGLLRPSGRSPGGARRYSEDDVAVLERIRELQDVMGLDLHTIRTIVLVEERLRVLREEYRERADEPRRAQILTEAIELNDQLREEVRVRQARMSRFLEDLNEKAARYRARLEVTEQGAAPHGTRGKT